MTLKKRTLVLSIFVISIFLVSGTIASVAAGGGGQKYYVNGTVKSTSGARISGAKVMLYADGKYVNTVYTSSTGYFSGSMYSYLVIRSWKAVVSKSGYYTNTKTASAGIPTTYMGTIYLTAIPPPPPPPKEYPTIGTPSCVRDAFEATISVSVGWHYNPYISRTVSLKIGPNPTDLTVYPMDLVGGIYQTTIDVRPTETYTYYIQATESWTGDSATSSTGFYQVGTVPIESYYEADCYDSSSWDEIYGYSFLHYPICPLSKDSDAILTASGSFSCSNIESTTQIGEYGTSFHQSLATEISMANIASFAIDLSCGLLDSGDGGSVLVALYDNYVDGYYPNYPSPDQRPLIYAKLTNVGLPSPFASLEIGYFDLRLGEIAIDLGQVESPWSGSVEFWYEDNVGFWVDSTISNPQYIPTGFHIPAATVAYVAMQWTEQYLETQPDMHVDGICIDKYQNGMIEEQFDLPKAVGLRSGPSSIYLGGNLPSIDRPGPSTEMQLFSSNGDPIKFELTYPSAPGGYTHIFVDSRLLSPSGITNTAQLTIRVLDSADILVDETIFTLDVDPFIYNLDFDPFAVPVYRSMNYLYEWEYVNIQDTSNTIELSVSGLDWGNGDNVALRGIWALADFLEQPVANWVLGSLKQIFVSSSITYYVPLGANTDLDLTWSGASSIEVFVDGISQFTKIPGGYLNLDLGDYSKDFHEIWLVSSPGAKVSVMHAVHDWVNIEVDFITWNGVDYVPDDLLTILNYIQDYYEDHTHGRIISYQLDPNHEGIELDVSAYPYDDPDSSETFYLWESDLIKLGNGNLVGHTTPEFENRGKGDWIWFIFVPSGPGLSFQAGALNLWDSWVGARMNYEWPSGVLAETMHELGHIAHSHEGYDDHTKPGWPCYCDDCVMGGFTGTDPGYCIMHWSQTWENIAGYANLHEWQKRWWLL